MLALNLLGIWSSAGSEVIEVTQFVGPGKERPVLVSLRGLSGEAAQVLQFDLYVQGFAFTNAEAAQYEISGSNNGNLEARAMQRVNNSVLLSKAYWGASLRRQVHRFADDFVNALPKHAKGIAQTQIMFKGEAGGKSEVYVGDFDGHGAQAVTRDNSIVAAPCWVPGRLAAYYTSYKLNHPDIFYQDFATGARRIFAGYGGSNMSPAVSPDGREVAMILSKDGWTDLYVGNAGGNGLRRLTRSPQDESSPCWSPDGKWICYASKDGERRSLSRVPAAGGQPERLKTAGVFSPTEPDWSPDGSLIAFTAQYRGGFRICVIPAGGGEATDLAEGEDPSWAPNSRTLICARRAGGVGNYVLSLLDVPTKQVKDVSRILGISSQSQPSWAK
ncbi:MAG: LpqB family beta-propeller domain-containing protein [Verrucomicrobiota bacterium]|jgi:TolB protein